MPAVKKNSSKAQKRKQHFKALFTARAKLIRRFEVFSSPHRTNFTPKEKARINYRYNQLKQYKNIQHIKINKKKRLEFKKRGYAITGRGVFIDKLRDNNRLSIKQTKTVLLSNNIVRETYTRNKKISRTDYIYNFTSQEKIEFLKHPEKFTKKIIAENPVLKNKFKIKELSGRRGKIHIRLQFGAYGTHKAMDLNIMDFYIALILKSKRRRKNFLAGFTGIRFVMFKNR